MSKLTHRDWLALRDAREMGGWALHNAKTTEKLAGRGLFEQATHPHWGRKWRLNAAGLAALASCESDASLPQEKAEP
jgi:hypothetical protein